MKNKLKKLRRVVVAFLSFLIICSPALAALDLSLGTIKQVDGSTDVSSTDLLDVSKNMIDAYYVTPPADPRTTTNRLLLAPNIVTYNTNAPEAKADWSDPTKYKGYISGGNYFFTRHTASDSPGANIYIRVWSSGPNVQGGYYAKASGSFSNGTTSTVMDTLNATTSYKADVPYTPNITKFEEIATTLADGTKTSSLNVFSAQSSATDGLREITNYSWKMGTSPAVLSTVDGATGRTLVLNSSQLDIGQTYYFEVTHTNWFGSKASSVDDYTVSGSSTTRLIATYPLTSTGLGINTLAIAFDASKGDIKGADDSVIVAEGETFTVAALITEVNRQAGSNVVQTFGYYDNTTKKQVGLVVVSDPLSESTPTSGDDAAEILAHVIDGEGEPYQVSVSSDVDFVLKGYK